jgi:CubicO group peptidase (beta-lactamase class C family)
MQKGLGPSSPTGRSPALRTGAAATLGAFLFAAAFGVQAGRGGVRPGAPAAPRAGAAPAAPAPRLSPAALDSAEGRVRAELERRAFPGAALAVGIGARTERLAGMGRVGWRESAAPVSPDSTLYDLASVTKPVATATAVLLLAQDGVIRLDDPVRRHLPQFEGRFKDRVTWRQLLTHTSGLPAGAAIRGDAPRERVRRILRTRIDEAPGTQVEYTDLGYVVLWEAAQRAAGEPLPRFLERRVWRPLGMTRTGFLPGQDCTACAPTLRLSTGEPFRGRPNDLLARRLGGVTGNAGLFSTAHDLGRFAAMLAGGGELDGVRVLAPETVREMLRQQPGAGRRTLGFVALCPREPHSEEKPCARPLAVGHNGWTGTSLWIEPERRAWTVLLTNRSYDVRATARMAELREESFRHAVVEAPVDVVSPDAGEVRAGE